MKLDFISVDIEPTNRCNAKCHFCPRDQTPHQGLMSPATFTQSLARAVEFQPIAWERFGKRTEVNLCGLGEPLLNKHLATFVHQVQEAGFEPHVSSNASLLDEKRGNELLDAGLKKIAINVGEEGDDYEAVYKLGWERTRDNVLQFAEMAKDRCNVQIVLVNHLGDLEHLEKVADFWRGHGLDDFMRFDLINRGGALFVDDMQYEQFPEITEAREMLTTDAGVAVCGYPFMFLFIGYDGQYYLCCSDWKKEAPLGSVFDVSFTSIIGAKLEHVISREPVCKTCNLDPVNHLTGVVRARNAGEMNNFDYHVHLKLIQEEDEETRKFVAIANTFEPETQANTSGRKLIPVTAL
jgi:MoaA/NifB/PqqE/SkfB family radical SAM enzyme